MTYRGPFRPADRLPGTDCTVLDALLSPTRTFAPVVRAILDEAQLSVSGLIHVTGGGHAKCLRFGHGVRYVIDLGDEVPAVFRAIKAAGGGTWLDMAKVFNLGYRMLVLCAPTCAAAAVDIAGRFGVHARIVGITEPSAGSGNELALRVAGESGHLSG